MDLKSTNIKSATMDKTTYKMIGALNVNEANRSDFSYLRHVLLVLLRRFNHTPRTIPLGPRAENVHHLGASGVLLVCELLVEQRQLSLLLERGLHREEHRKFSSRRCYSVEVDGHLFRRHVIDGRACAAFVEVETENGSGGEIRMIVIRGNPKGKVLENGLGSGEIRIL